MRDYGASSRWRCSRTAPYETPHAAEGHADAAEKHWNQMSGAHLTASAEAELAHVRKMMEALQGSLAAYKKAEQEIMTTGKKTTTTPI